MTAWTHEAAEAHERAWEACQHVGERYLEARYEREARVAGYDVTPPADEEVIDPAANEIESLRDSIAHFEAMLRVFEDPHTAFDIILNAEDTDEAQRALSEHFDFTEAQASETLANLSSAGTISNRRRLENAREEALTRPGQLGS